MSSKKNVTEMDEESIVKNVSFKLNGPGMKEDELVGNYIFFLVCLCGILFLVLL